jgi:succinoglycan biosynthesis protein ExoH
MPNHAAAVTIPVTLDGAIALRIEFLRITLIAGIVLLHTPPTWLLESLPPAALHWPGVIKLFFDYGPLRAGLPVLSLISGYLLFLRPYPTYAILVRRKLSTLVVPFLIWNGIVIALHALRGQNDLARFQLAIADPLSWLMMLDKFLDGPPNYPTYFLIDLSTLALLSPLIGVLLARAPVITLIAGGLAAAIGHGPIPTVRADVALPFMAGAAAAIHQIDPRLLDRYVWPLLIGFLLLSVAFIASLATEMNTPLSLGLVRTAGVPALWALSSVLAPTTVGRRLAKLSGMAFVLFCAHSPALNLLASVWPNSVSYWLFYATAAPLVILTVLLVSAGLRRWGGGALDLLTGARLRGRLAQEKH